MTEKKPVKKCECPLCTPPPTITMTEALMISEGIRPIYHHHKNKPKKESNG